MHDHGVMPTTSGTYAKRLKSEHPSQPRYVSPIPKKEAIPKKEEIDEVLTDIPEETDLSSLKTRVRSHYVYTQEDLERGLGEASRCYGS